MDPIWQNSLTATGGHIVNGEISDFGDAEAELAAAERLTVAAPLTHLGIIDVAGVDAGAFLHSQLTSDVKHLGPDAVQHSAWCSAKGRMLASFLVFRSAATYRLQLAADLMAPISKRLQMFVLRSQVTIADRSGREQLIGVSGPQAVIALEKVGLPAPEMAMTSAPFAAGIVVRLDSTRFEIVVDGNAAPNLWPRLLAHARPVGTPAWQWLDIRAGVPLITRRTAEEFVPQMADFERLGGVSFHKGCYPGQEIIARTQYLGKVKRHLYRVHAANSLAPGDAIFSPAAPERPCGMVANAAPAPGGGYDALAVVQEAFAAGTLDLGAPGGPCLQLEPVDS